MTQRPSHDRPPAIPTRRTTNTRHQMPQAKRQMPPDPQVATPAGYLEIGRGAHLRAEDELEGRLAEERGGRLDLVGDPVPDLRRPRIYSTHLFAMSKLLGHY